MSFTKNSDKILDRLSSKLAKHTPYRGDFALADFRVIDADKKEAEVLLSYDPRKGVPTKEAVAETLLYFYKAQDERPRLLVDLNSIQYYPQHEAVACRVSVPRYRRPFEDVKRCNLKPIIAGTMFLGENMEDTWRVAKSAEGGVFIERLEEEDIDTILRERSRAKGFRAPATASALTLNRIHASKPQVKYGIGDLVKCTHKGKARVGEVVGISETGAQLRFQNGEQATVSIDAMYGLVKASDESFNAQMDSIKEYYRKAYGYSEEDLNKLVTPLGQSSAMPPYKK